EVAVRHVVFGQAWRVVTQPMVVVVVAANMRSRHEPMQRPFSRTEIRVLPKAQIQSTHECDRIVNNHRFLQMAHAHTRYRIQGTTSVSRARRPASTSWCYTQSKP